MCFLFPFVVLAYISAIIPRLTISIAFIALPTPKNLNIINIVIQTDEIKPRLVFARINDNKKNKNKNRHKKNKKINI